MYSLDSTFDQLWIQLSHAVSACRLETSKSSVHDLRTGTRRMEALLTKALEDHRSASELQTHATRALRQLKKLRKLAGPIRDLDVHLHLLRKLCEHHAAAIPRREYASLEEKLLRDRRRLAAHLPDHLDRKELKLERTFERIATALKGLTAPSPTPLTTARKWLRRSASHIGHPTEQNLHDLRKQTKSARYLAELQPGSIAARHVAAHLHVLQDAIGQWHDRQLLEANARRILGDQAALPAALKTRNHLTRALRLARKAPPA